jgi:hypothetical protein
LPPAPIAEDEDGLPVRAPLDESARRELRRPEGLVARMVGRERSTFRGTRRPPSLLRPSRFLWTHEPSPGHARPTTSGQPGPGTSPRTAATDTPAVWTGSLMIVWGGGGNGDSMPTGFGYDPATDSWSRTSLTGAPAGRRDHIAAWTGSEMLVWGGASSGSLVSTGGRYNPVSDTWTSMSAVDAPAGRAPVKGVWNRHAAHRVGRRYDSPGHGGRYGPQRPTRWTPTSTAGAPRRASATRPSGTGTQMIVWGAGPIRI